MQDAKSNSLRSILLEREPVIKVREGSRQCHVVNETYVDKDGCKVTLLV